MKDRVRQVRKEHGMSQTEFGKACGVSLSAVHKWETGQNEVSDAVILLICQRFGVNELWLRTGSGSMKAPEQREKELATYIRQLLADRPDSFRSALITTLLRFDPNGPEWAVLEAIFQKTVEEAQKEPRE